MWVKKELFCFSTLQSSAALKTDRVRTTSHQPKMKQQLPSALGFLGNSDQY